MLVLQLVAGDNGPMISSDRNRRGQRRAVVADLIVIQQIERRAGEVFRTVGMAQIADDEPVTAADFAPFLRTDGAWVALDDHDQVIGYLLVEQLDEAAHIEQVTVHPAAARHGIGAGLIDRAGAWAAGRGLGSLTLTTFSEVGWNAPYYLRLGFTIIEPAEQGPALARRVADEAAGGLARWPRVAMRRPV